MKKLVSCFVLCFCLWAPGFAEAGRSTADTSRAESFAKYYGLLPDEEVQKRINDLGQKLIAANSLNPADFSFAVINSGEINAVTLPGGYIYVFKGLVDFMPTDDELAAVIGHEMGHVMKNHIARREREQLFTAILGAILAGPQGAIAANAALASLPAYSQRDEREADDCSYKYMMGAGMNPYAVLVVMNKLGDTEKSGVESNFAQHPKPAERAARIEKYIQQQGITPVVVNERGRAKVTDGDWSFAIERPDGADKPLYRGWLLAGNLYVIARAGVPDADKFIVVEQPDNAQIYYDGHLVYSVGELDVLAANSASPAQQAAVCVEQLRAWAMRLATNSSAKK